MTKPTPMRADARRNREKLLVAAREQFAAAGTDVPLDAVAKAAGVGIGTLYRHFPTREALVEAAYRAEVADLAQTAGQLLEAHAPDRALAEWMERFVGYAVAKRGMKGVLSEVSAGGSDVFGETRAEILAAIDQLLAAGIAAGTLRDDVTAADIWRAMGGVWSISDTAQIRTLLRIVMDGLRRPAAPPS